MTDYGVPGKLRISVQLIQISCWFPVATVPIENNPQTFNRIDVWTSNRQFQAHYFIPMLSLVHELHSEIQSVAIHEPGVLSMSKMMGCWHRVIP